ncbi:MAG: DUF3617 domain-containing protein [Pseudomonadota bacterium]
MNFRPSALILLSLAAIASACASAQTTRAGLWEVTNKLEGAGDPRMQEMANAQKHDMNAMRAQMEKMPPEQRKAMEGMMKKLGQGSMLDKDGMTLKVCVTPDMAAQNQLTQHQRANCTNTRSPVVGGMMKVSYACTKPDSTGEGTVSFTGDTGYTMNMTMHITAGGRNQTTSMSSKGKWLSSNCGDVKPPTLPKEYRRP